MDLSINLLLVIATAAISYFALENRAIMDRFILYPFRDSREKKWYTIFTSGFLHANFNHLLFNMITLYFLGGYSLQLFENKYKMAGGVIYILFYLLALAASSIPSFFKHKDNAGYRALGASGAVSAVIFHFVMDAPWEMLGLMMVIPVPAIVVGVLYLVYESYMAKKANDNIGHDAHLAGAVFGIISYVVIFPERAKFFFDQLLSPPFL